jgi:hypothetical protein
MKWLVDERYPDAELIRVILDNLNTHGPGSFYEAFPPEEAFRIARKLEFHCEPPAPRPAHRKGFATSFSTVISSS